MLSMYLIKSFDTFHKWIDHFIKGMNQMVYIFGIYDVLVETRDNTYTRS